MKTNIKQVKRILACPRCGDQKETASRTQVLCKSCGKLFFVSEEARIHRLKQMKAIAAY